MPTSPLPVCVTLMSLGCGMFCGCAGPPDRGATPVTNAWQRSHERTRADSPAPSAGEDSQVEGAIVSVNGKPIEREQVSRLLLAGRGVPVLEELIVLELARTQAEQDGLTVSKRDLQAERRRALRSLLSQLPSAEPDQFDAEAAERVLENILASRGISRQEYRLGTLRNAYLRKLAHASLVVNEDHLWAEYVRAYGKRVRVRHIQLLSAADVADVQRQLDAGADFAELARRHSANALTAPSGGALAPFARDDPAVPALLRETAFRIMPGEASNAIRIDNWLHLVMVEERLPVVEIPFERVRNQLETRVRERLIDGEMQRISAELFGRARVEIADPKLEAAFFKRHPTLRRSLPQQP